MDVCIHEWMYVSMHVKPEGVFMCQYVCMCGCVYVRVSYVCVYVCMYTYMHMHAKSGLKGHVCTHCERTYTSTCAYIHIQILLKYSYIHTLK
jgi:hypothetical protein